MFPKEHIKGSSWLCGEISHWFLLVHSQNRRTVQQKSLHLLSPSYQNIDLTGKMGATEMLSNLGLVEEPFLVVSLNNVRGNLNMNVWDKPTHTALASLGALRFPLPAHGSKLPGFLGIWGGSTAFVLLLSLKGIYWWWSPVQAEQYFGTARPWKKKNLWGTWSVLYSSTFTAPLLNNVSQ